VAGEWEEGEGEASDGEVVRGSTEWKAELLTDYIYGLKMNVCIYKGKNTIWESRT